MLFIVQMNLFLKKWNLVNRSTFTRPSAKNTGHLQFSCQVPSAEQVKDLHAVFSRVLCKWGQHDMYMGTEICCTFVVHGDAKTHQCK